MKKTTVLLALLLCFALILPCVSGIAESGSAAGQPVSYIDQDTFLTWFRTYEPEAKITWEPWYYCILFFNGKNVGTVTADLSDDQSTVLTGYISVLDDVPKEAQSIINALCKVYKDKFSSKALKELKTGEWMNPKEVLSDKGKLSFSYDTRHVKVSFLVDEAELMPVDKFYKTITVKKVYSTSKSRHAVISRSKYVSSDDYFSLTEEERIAYYEDSLTAYHGEVNLDGAGCVTSLSVGIPKETNDAESIRAFLLDAATRLVSGEILESIQAIIGEKLPAVLDDAVRESVYEHIGTVRFSLSNESNRINMSFTLDEPVPEDAAGFINGQKFALE